MGKASRRKKTVRSDDLQHELENQGVRAELDSLKAGIVPEGIPLGQEKCDFCSSEDVQWAYRTTSKDQTKDSEEGGGWAACDPCHTLIERGRFDLLATRSAQMYIRNNPILESIGVRQLADHFREFHENFRKNRVGEAMSPGTYFKRYGRKKQSRMGQFLGESGLNELAGAAPTPGDQIARPTPAGPQVLHHVETDEGTTFIPEGFTPEQLTDPRTIEYLMSRISRDRPVPKIPITMPIQPVIKRWVGARTYLQACAGVYGETPRADDIFVPKASMMMASLALEGILGAHPIVLEPGQMNSIDDQDWSFAEAVEYAKMAYLPFEPLYLDFGGHEPVMVDLKYGPCQLHGAIFWRSSYFRTPSLAVCPIGGFDYLTGPLADGLLEMGMPLEDVIAYVGQRPGKEINSGQQSVALRGPELEFYKTTHRQLQQWSFQPAGIVWFGLDPALHTPEDEATMRDFLVVENEIQQDRGISKVPMTFSTGKGIAASLGEERLQPAASAIALTGIYPDPGLGESRVRKTEAHWTEMASAATEMVTRLCERALLGLYFLENAPVQIEEAPLSRPERREMHRDKQKGRDPGKIASIVVIQSNRSSGSRSEEPGSRNYSHRWERRGHFRHYHDNTRHYQHRPDLIKPCHKCAYEYEENLRAQREGKTLPYPNTESPDCIKQWIEPVVCGPEDKDLKVKVRVRRKDQPNEEAA